MQVVAVLPGLVVGLVLWSILLMSSGSNPVGRTSAFDHLVIFSPVIGVVLPVALNLLEAKRSVPGTWLLDAKNRPASYESLWQTLLLVHKDPCVPSLGVS